MSVKNDKVTLLEQLYIAAHVIDDMGSILWANPYEVNMLGYLPEEFIGHNFSEVRNDTEKRAQLCMCLSCKISWHNAVMRNNTIVMCRY